MKATLIFDNVNDILFSKWDEAFIERMKSLSDQENNENITDSYNVAQLLSPIITSQRVMAAQFGNTYTSMQCKDGTTIVFDEWLDHVFIIISKEKVDDAHRELMDCKTFVQHICGQNINLLHSPVYQEWLSQLLECRTKGDWIPGASGIIGKSGATAAALNALKTAAKEIKCSYNHYHLMIFVGDKLLALYSSRGCEDLTPPDLILMSVQCIAAQEYWNDLEKCDDTQDGSPRLPWLSMQNSGIVHTCAGSSVTPAAPHSLHLARAAHGITFAVLVDMELRDVGVTTAISNQIIYNLRKILLQRNLELLPTTLDSLEASLKKTSDAVRKSKIPSSSNLTTRLGSRMLELRRATSSTAPLTPDTAAAALQAALEAVIETLKPDIPSLRLEQPLKELQNILTPYVEFLQVKAMRCFGLGSESGSGSLTLHKYVEEFPGLVHFVYIDRSAGRVLQPDLQDCSDMLTKEMVRDIVSSALSAVREGYCGSAWRRGALHVCAVRWAARGGGAVRGTAARAAVRALPPPADITNQFYRQLTELSFPNDSQRVSIKELICMHLGLVPASTAVQQARRLAHSVPEIAGDNPALATDLL